MKKNEKGFAQNEKDLENVAGGAGDVKVNTTVGPITFSHSKTSTSEKSQNVELGNVNSISGTSFSVN